MFLYFEQDYHCASVWKSIYVYGNPKVYYFPIAGKTSFNRNYSVHHLALTRAKQEITFFSPPLQICQKIVTFVTASK